MIVHLVDGTYELFRQFYGLRRFTKGKDRPYGAVVGVLQIDGRRKTIRDAAGIREKFGVDPPLIPDLLALLGDAADGYPGIPGFGARTAAQLLNRYGQIENFPSNVLGERRNLALLFKNLATLRTDAPLFKKVETLRWRGATPAFAAWADRMKALRLLERCEKVKLDRK